jgi:hypothetical protein
MEYEFQLLMCYLHLDFIMFYIVGYVLKIIINNHI